MDHINFLIEAWYIVRCGGFRDKLSNLDSLNEL